MCPAYPDLVTSIDTDTGTGTDTDTLADGRTDYRLDDGDHERFSHFADKDKIMEAMVTGTPVVALCGKVWVPSRDPKKFPSVRSASGSTTSDPRAGCGSGT